MHTFRFFIILLLLFCLTAPVFTQTKPKEIRFNGNLKLLLKEGYFIGGDEATVTDMDADYTVVINGHALLCDGANIVSADKIEYRKNTRFTATGNIKIRHNLSFLTADKAEGELNRKIIRLNSSKNKRVIVMAPEIELPVNSAVSLSILEKTCLTMGKELMRLTPAGFLRHGYNGKKPNKTNPVYFLESKKMDYSKEGEIIASGNAQWLKIKDTAGIQDSFIRLIINSNKTAGNNQKIFSQNEFTNNIVYILRGNQLVYNPKTRNLKATDQVTLFRGGNTVSTDAILLKITESDYTVSGINNNRVKLNITPSNNPEK